ncbi:MAG: hypothetical protein QM731_15490 [Chitinophagaceae bacterium]
MRFILICFLLVIEACSDHTHPDKTIQPLLPVANTAISIPATVTAYINNNLPGWNIVSKEDYATSFWSFYDSNTTPFFAAVDLNDDRVADYAVIIKKENIAKPVILLSDGASFKHWITDDLNQHLNEAGNDVLFCLLPEPPGQVDVVKPAISSLILTNNAVNLMYLENRQCIFYWDGTQIAVFKTL